MTFAKSFRQIIVAALVIPSVSVSLAAQQGVGAIGGTVLDATGAVLPGVSINLSNPGTIGGNQQAVTDERGTYRFARLVPGRTYSVRAELSGFSTAIRDGIIVSADATTRVDLTLRVGEVSETVTVTGASPVVDTSSTLKQTVLETETLSKLPTGRDLWTAARLVPSAVITSLGGGGYDVGGTGSLLQSIPTVHGNQRTENRYYMDGQDVTAINAAGLANSYFDTSMFQEVNFQSGNALAESEMGGVVFNMVTKTGTNVVHGGFVYTGTDDALQSNNVTPDLRRQLLAGVPPRVLLANPNLEPSATIVRFYDVEGNVSGPIFHDRLWFMVSSNVKPLDQFRLGSYNPDGTQFVDDNKQWNYGFKISWQATKNNQVHYTWQSSHRTAYHRITDASAFWESRAAIYQDLAFTTSAAKWTSVLSPRLVMEVSAGAYTGITPFHQRPEVSLGDVPRWDSATNTYTVAYIAYNETFPGTVNANASLTYAVGNHSLKLGYQPAYLWNKADTWSTSNYPAGFLAIFRNGRPDSVRAYNTPVSIAAYTMDHGVFAQDAWRPISKLTLNIGIRLQKTSGWVPAHCQAETIFIGSQCYSRIEDTPAWFDVAPRFGAIYDLLGTGRTALKLGLNRYYITEGPNHPARVDPLRVAFDTRAWADSNGDGVPQLNEFGPSTGFNTGSTSRYKADLKRPYTNELNVSIEQQFPGNIGLAVGYYHREGRRYLGSRNLAVPPESYTPLQVTERASGVEVTVYNQDPATRGRFDVLIDNSSEMNTRFNGVDVTLTKRLSNHWMILGGLALGKNTGDTYGIGSDLNNPNFTFRSGRVTADVPVSFKLAGILELPYAISFSGNVQHYSGFPESDTVRVSSDTVALTQVTQVIRVAPQGTNRLPGVNLIDLAVRRAFRVGRASFEPAAELFNLANANTVTQRNTLIGPTYQRVTGILSGRLVRFGVQVTF